MPSVRRKNKLGVFLVDEKSVGQPFVKAFKDAVAAFNSYGSQICLKLEIVTSEAEANVKVYRLRYGEKLTVSWPDGPDSVLDGSKRQDNAHTWVMEYEGKTKRAEIIGAACGIVVTKPGGNENPAMAKLFLVHEFIHTAGLDDNKLHDPDGGDVFAASAGPMWESTPPDPLLGEQTISKLKRVWCDSAQKISLTLESRPHQA